MAVTRTNIVSDILLFIKQEDIKMDELQKYELEALLEELGGYRGKHTELITSFIPAGASLTQTKKQLEDEKGTASNIKSSTTKKNVINALELAVRRLQEIGRTPENGLAIFSGLVTMGDGRESLESWAIEPPKKLNTKIYRCDQTFVLGPLQDMVESDDVYGLLIIELNEASIGLLDGTNIKLLKKINSGVPGQHKTGGQCLSPDTLVMKDNGEVILIDEVDDSSVIIGEDFNKEVAEKTGVVAKWGNSKELFEVTTCYPRIKIKASADHTFFIRTDTGIIEKSLSDIKKGDYLIIPEEINVKGKVIKLDSKQYYNSFSIELKGRVLIKRRREKRGLCLKDLAKSINLTEYSISRYERGTSHISRKKLIRLCGELNIDYNMFINKYTIPHKCKEIALPSKIDKRFAQVLGYFVGDGAIENGRLSFFEGRQCLSYYYKNLFDKLFNINTSHRFRKDKNYYQLRIDSMPLTRLIRGEFPESIGSLVSEIPEKILRSTDNILAAFVSGLFDADGYVSSNRVAIGLNNEKIIRQLQLSLLRFGIISSVLEYDNCKNPYSDNIKYTLTIDDLESIKRFEKFMNFNAEDKKLMIREFIKNRSGRSKVRKVSVGGKEVSMIIRSHGVTTSQFRCSSFFGGRRQMSKNIFKKKIIDKITNNKLKEELKKFYLSNIIPVKISNIKSIGVSDTVDIETSSHNFVANGIITHNSAQRFERIRDSKAKEFYKKTADYMKKFFWDNKKLKGILIGGGGPAKEHFLKQGQLVTQLKNKVIAVKNMGGDGMDGLHELVGLCEKDLEEQEITKQRIIIDLFLEMLGKNPNMVSYGEAEVLDRLNRGAVDKLILSKSLSRDKIKHFKKLAEASSAEVHIVGDETPTGIQFKNLGGYGGLLRFEIYD